jgi:hypothetical protein
LFFASKQHFSRNYLDNLANYPYALLKSVGRKALIVPLIWHHGHILYGGVTEGRIIAASLVYVLRQYYKKISPLSCF